MITIERRAPLDAMRATEQLPGSLFTNESRGHMFVITAVRANKPVVLDGSVSAIFIKPDRIGVQLTSSYCGIDNDGHAWAQLSANCYEQTGAFGLVITHIDGNGCRSVLYSAVGVIRAGETAQTVDPANVINVDAIQAIISDMEDAIEDCEAAAATASAAMAGLDISGEAMENASQAYTGDRWLEFKFGRWAANTIGTPTDFSETVLYVCTICPCVKGDKFLIDVFGKATTVNRTIVILDSDKNVLWRSSTAHITGVYTVPTDQTWSDSAAYICFNNLLESQPSGYYAIKCSSTLTEKLAAKQDALTFDNVPTEGSANPVKSGGVYSAVSQIHADMDTLKAAIGGYEAQIPAGSSSGYYWNNETDTAVKTAYSSYKAYNPISCSPGEVYRVLGYEATSQKQQLVLVVDEDYTILSAYGGHTQTVKEYEFTVPSGGAYILMTTVTGHTAKCYERHLNSIPGGVFGGMFEYADANVAIIGDSISTNGNWSSENPLGNVPEIVVEEDDVGVELSAYVTYYDIGTTIGGHTITEADVGTELTFTPTADDVGKVIGKPLNNNSESVVTWWEVARDTLGFNVIPVCWAGSSITDHEINAQDNGHYIYKCSNAFHPSQIRKCGIRTPGTMTRTAPDMVIIYRGTNDFSHSPYARLNYDLTAYQPSGYPTEDTYSDSGTTRYDYVAGMLMTIKAVRDAYPSAKVVLCTLNYFKRLSSSVPGFPTRNGQNTLEQYNDTIRAIANYANCDLIDFAKDGITAWNAGDGYYDTVNNPTHPTTKGHKVMGNRAIRDLMDINGLT